MQALRAALAPPSSICVSCPCPSNILPSLRPAPTRRALATRGALFTPAEALLTWRVSVDCMVLGLLLRTAGGDRRVCSSQCVQIDLLRPLAIAIFPARNCSTLGVRVLLWGGWLAIRAIPSMVLQCSN